MRDHQPQDERTPAPAPAHAVDREVATGRAAAPEGSTAAALLDLQRDAGNQAVAAQMAQRQVLGEGVTAATSGSGMSLPGPLRLALESHVGADLSGVRVHQGGAAARSAADLGAEAYTVGEHIVLGQGSGDLGSPGGQHRIAHEATHVVQQRQGPVTGTEVESGLAVSHPGDAFERDAEASAHAFMREGHAH